MVTNYRTIRCEPITYVCEVTTNRPDLGDISGSGTYSDGMQITVTVVPATGVQFVGWERMGEIVSTDQKYTLTITRTTRLKAVFVRLCNITSCITPSGCGMVSGAKVYLEGDQVTLRAEECVDGYSFISWMVDGEIVSQEPIYSFVATEDLDIEAKFGVPREVTLNTTLGGADYLSETKKYAQGDTITLHAAQIRLCSHYLQKQKKEVE